MLLNRTRAFLAVLTLAAALPAATLAQAVPISVPTVQPSAAEPDLAAPFFDDAVLDRKSTRLNSSHSS